ncbi:hypothetical protein [Deinococcus aestuarii]|uniref:hypothetical protein n=1 Tax=Deinococcus aestuarii TaxID=2774531 RepID=UPI001C0DC2AE|nr:hypothetical protein [Deinococcus aestuarii]
MTRETALPEEVDLREMLTVLRRAALLIVLATLPVALSAYVATSRLPTLYASTAALMTVDRSTGRFPDAALDNTLTSAPALPPGALAGALRSPGVVEDIIGRLGSAGQGAPLVRAVAADLRSELAQGRFVRLALKSPDPDAPGGVYELRAQAETPGAARALASAGTGALLAWDQARSQRDVDRAQTILRRQFQDLTRLLAAGAGDASEQARLRQARAEVWQALTRVDSLDAVVGGTLAVVTPPVAPLAPVSPKPLRTALLAGLLMALLTGGLALLGQLLRPVVYGPPDLARLGLPVLGQLPRVRPARPGGSLLTGGPGDPWARALGFLGLNLLAARHGGRVVVLVSGVTPGVGASSVTAGLAGSLGRRGYRVLVVEADLERPSPLALGTAAPEEGTLAGQAVPGQTRRVAPNVDLLSGADVAARLERSGPPGGLPGEPGLSGLLDVWGEAYDVVLVDTPPLTRQPEIAALAAGGDGVLLVVEAGRTRRAAVVQAAQTATLAGGSVIGLVLNRCGAPRRDRLPGPPPAPRPTHEPGHRRGVRATEVVDAD